MIVNEEYGYLQRKCQNVSLREINLTKENDLLHYSDNRVLGCTMDKCWAKCLEQSNYHEQLQEVQKFNKANKTLKQGIAIVPMKFGVTMGMKAMMQGVSSVQIYKDGSILLQTGILSYAA